MNAFLETVKIIGVKRFIRVAYRLLTDGAAREMDFYHPIGEYSLVEATSAARRALGGRRIGFIANPICGGPMRAMKC